MNRNRYNIPELLYDLAMVLLFVITVSVLMIYAKTVREIGKYQMEQYVERQLTDFSINYFLHNSEKNSWLEENIQGIGIFDSAGRSVFVHGQVPPSLEDFAIDDRLHISYGREDKSLTYIRAIPPLTRPNQRVFSVEEGERESSEPHIPLPRPLVESLDIFRHSLDSINDDEWIILYIKSDDYWYSRNNPVRNNMLLMITLVPLLLAVFTAGSAVIFHRFMKSQRQLNEQKNLVLLGTAVRTISHEMKNPLGSIYLQLPLINKLTGDTVARETNIIRSEVERMTSLISWISDFLKDPQGISESLDPAQELDKARLRFPPELNWHIPACSAALMMDRERFRSVIDNLVNNALESGSEFRNIHIYLELSGGKTVIRVKDRGLGIPAEHLKKIFDPFFTSKSRGSGVGLAVTKRFIEAADGTIRIRSEEGKGTEITVILKRHK